MERQERCKNHCCISFTYSNCFLSFYIIKQSLSGLPWLVGKTWHKWSTQLFDSLPIVLVPVEFYPKHLPKTVKDIFFTLSVVESWSSKMQTAILISLPWSLGYFQCFYILKYFTGSIMFCLVGTRDHNNMSVSRAKSITLPSFFSNYWPIFFMYERFVLSIYPNP